MKLGAVYRESDNRCLVPQVWKAVSAIDRMRGLLWRPALKPGEGLMINTCNLVHTVGMHYALDLVFLDATGHIKKLVWDLKPLRCAGAFAATTTLELPAGTLRTLNLGLSEQLTWRTFEA